MAGLDADAVATLLAAQFPQAAAFVAIEEVGPTQARCRWRYQADHLRPGGTVSGPTLMTLADTAMYYLLLAQLGPVALAVTTSLNINFLRRPPPAAVRATARLLKLGQRLAVGEIHMRSMADDGLIAQASATYALPPDRGVGP